LAASETLLRAAGQNHRTSDDDDGDRRPSFHEFHGARRHHRTYVMMMILAVHHFIDASETRTVAVSFTVAAIFPSLAAIIEFITKRVTQFKFASAFCKSNSGLRSWHWS